MKYEQLDIFSLIQPQENEYCWDSDINEIHKMLICLAKNYGLEITADKFSIWSHVPKYGYRLEFEVRISRKDLNDDEFINEIDKIVKYAESKKIELSPMWRAAFFFHEAETAILTFYSTFMDTKRRRRK